MQFAATNRGGQSHLTGELFRERAKVNITFVHAQGAATSLNDVTAGRVPIMFEGLAGLAPGLQGGGLKLLGIATVSRLPNLPTISETAPGVVLGRAPLPPLPPTAYVGTEIRSYPR
jgi:tripartite-type tricarboxylate transporter receptor subunit TctC